VSTWTGRRSKNLTKERTHTRSHWDGSVDRRVAGLELRLCPTGSGLRSQRRLPWLVGAKDTDMATGVTPLTVVPPQKRYAASIHPGKDHVLPDGFVQGIQKLETALGMPVWFMIHSGGTGEFDDLETPTRKCLCSHKNGIAAGQPIALVVDSSGGSVKCAYQIARYLRRTCGGFTAVVPEWAKSAATLLVLGADRIILGKNAELGPLDVQIIDPDREQRISALDEVQALDRLNSFALQAIDAQMLLLVRRSGKTMNVLLPGAQHFVAEMLQPLFEKIDTVHYTYMSRLLKVAEEYAVRLLSPKYSTEKAQAIARNLVHQYPEHGFFIDSDEASKIGLETVEAQGEMDSAIEMMLEYIQDVTYIGRLEEIT